MLVLYCLVSSLCASSCATCCSTSLRNSCCRRCTSLCCFLSPSRASVQASQCFRSRPSSAPKPSSRPSQRCDRSPLTLLTWKRSVISLCISLKLPEWSCTVRRIRLRSCSSSSDNVFTPTDDWSATLLVSASLVSSCSKWTLVARRSWQNLVSSATLSPIQSRQWEVTDVLSSWSSCRCLNCSCVSWARWCSTSWLSKSCWVWESCCCRSRQLCLRPRQASPSSSLVA
mmetsp:Transcript_1709/g.6672  ORF Transcript_1709/g.6672 Transcript_1709/m.6672 type:complete len:228 (+) Transcript_1709:405-1088(+)